MYLVGVLLWPGVGWYQWQFFKGTVANNRMCESNADYQRKQSKIMCMYEGGIIYSLGNMCSQRGAIVFRWHPGAPAQEIEAFRTIARDCLYKHVITPYKELPGDAYMRQ